MPKQKVVICKIMVTVPLEDYDRDAILNALQPFGETEILTINSKIKK